MGWVIEIAKALVLCTATAFVLALASMIFPLNNSKATGIDLVFRLTGSRLALVGVVNFVVGLLLTRLTVVGDAAGRWHLRLR
jgi:hypothetical protein